MRKLGWLVMLASPALWADSLVNCQQDATSGKLFCPISTGWSTAHSCWGLTGKSPVRETFAERALSSRAGERVKLSNKRYCTERMPDAGRLKAHLQAQFGREQG